MKVTKILLTVCVMLYASIAFPLSMVQERREQPQAKVPSPVDSEGNKVQSSETAIDIQKKRLAEINAAINELERKSAEIVTQRAALQAERSTLITSISRADAEQEFKNSPGYLVVGIVDESSVTLLMHGHEKTFRLLGLLPLRREDAISFLKKALVGGRAYVRCEDSNCNWGFIYADREGESLNRKMVDSGLAIAQSSLSLEDRLKQPVPDQSPIPSSSGAASDSRSSASTSGTSPSTGSTRSAPGTEVQVKGYTRKDGTYVPPHTRSAPRRKP